VTIALEPARLYVRRWLRPGRQAALVVSLDETTEDDLSESSLGALAARLPQFSARETLSQPQKVALAALAYAAVVTLFVAPLLMASVFCGVLTLVYGGAVLYRIICFKRGLRGDSMVRVSDEEALRLVYVDLPVWTILVPAYREPTVIAKLLDNVELLDYPRTKLDVLLLLESDDAETLAAIREAEPKPYVRVVVVPESDVTTKPRACNYGLQLARGDYVTIYDAEDRPDPLQLRKAAAAFRRLGPETACLQARLAYFNADQNVITRWFTAEYVTWFAHFLPGLVSLGSPLPLGGTSNHIRTEVLREVGGWDPYNVTEDADLGMRLHRLRYGVEVLDSVTYEEANSDFVNWVKQRSRWYKGYLQTWLVHMRHPVQLRRQLGTKGFIGVNLFIGGTPLLSLLNPVFWGMTIFYFAGKVFAGAPSVLEEIFSGPLYYVALLCFLAGNFAMIYMGVVSIRETGRPELLLSALIVPAYWAMMALAAIKAAIQLVQQPSFWEKTTHGLDTPASGDPSEAEPPASPAGAPVPAMA